MKSKQEKVLEFLRESREEIDLVWQREEAGLLMKMGRREEAESLWKQIFEKTGDRRDAMALMFCALEAGDEKQVLYFAEMILEEKKRDIPGYFAVYYRAAATKKQDPDKAKEYFEEALEELKQLGDTPEETALIPIRIFTYLELGMNQEALDDVERMKEAALSHLDEEEEKKQVIKQAEAMREDIRKRIESFA